MVSDLSGGLLSLDLLKISFFLVERRLNRRSTVLDGSFTTEVSRLRWTDNVEFNFGKRITISRNSKSLVHGIELSVFFR